MFRDHDIVIDRYGVVYVVLGNYHPVQMVYLYAKYIPTKKPSYWCREGGVCFERVLKDYSVEEVRRISMQRWCYDSFYGGSVPCIPINEVVVHLKPQEGVERLLHTTRDTLERDALQLILLLKDLSSLPLQSFGITGSILLSIHNTVLSDIDLVVYGCKEAQTLVQIINNSKEFIELTPSEQFSRAHRIAVLLHIDFELAKLLYRKWKRFRWKNRIVSFIPVNTEWWNRERFVVKNRGCIEIKGYVPPEQCTALMYPSETWMYVGNREFLIRSYENVFSPILYEGGEIEVRGLLQETSEEFEVVSVGTSECGGYVRPLQKANKT
ncbi:MAG: hypothetical protein DRO12_00680 [Thermoprotei archaeon]|nr:MAG: hypothetical protein DRO12_00680 [Thermoprotei archaeon]